MHLLSEPLSHRAGGERPLPSIISRITETNTQTGCQVGSAHGGQDPVGVAGFPTPHFLFPAPIAPSFHLAEILPNKVEDACLRELGPAVRGWSDPSPFSSHSAAPLPRLLPHSSSSPPP